jgi:hypothetical protein
MQMLMNTLVVLASAELVSRAISCRICEGEGKRVRLVGDALHLVHVRTSPGMLSATVSAAFP